MTEDTEKLAACPFCGNDGAGPIEGALHVIHSQLDWRESWDSYAVQCDKCTATMGYSDSEDEAIAAWNTRSTPPTQPDDGLARELVREALMEFAFHCESEGGEPFMAVDIDDAVQSLSRLTTTDRSEQVREAAAKALASIEMARTGVVNPANGSRPYSYVEFAGARIEFQQTDVEVTYHNGSPVYDGATGKAAAQAQLINDLLHKVATRAAEAALPPSPKTTPNDGLRELLREARELLGLKIRRPGQHCAWVFDDRVVTSEDLFARIDAALSSTAHGGQG